MNLTKHKTQGSALVTLLGGVIILISVVFLLAKLANSGYHSEVAQTTESATETRIMPSGRLVLGDGTEPGQRTGEQVFNKICLQCHGADATVAFAPKVTHNDQWAARIAQGLDTLVQHAVKGFTGAGGGVMPAKGGSVDLTDDEVMRAVVYMANQSGANFSESGSSGASAAASDTAAASGSASAAAPAKTDVAAGGRGQEIFEKSCKVCHGAASVIPGIPRVTHNDEWAPRIKQGEETLFKHAIGGFNSMPAKGGHPDLSDDDIKATVLYMIKQSGG